MATALRTTSLKYKECR